MDMATRHRIRPPKHKRHVTVAQQRNSGRSPAPARDAVVLLREAA